MTSKFSPTCSAEGFCILGVSGTADDWRQLLKKKFNYLDDIVGKEEIFEEVKKILSTKESYLISRDGLKNYKNQLIVGYTLYSLSVCMNLGQIKNNIKKELQDIFKIERFPKIDFILDWEETE